jgi:hypothetical protein
MSRFRILLLLLLAALCGAGCSTVRLSYGQAERLAGWYAESYVTLDRRQSRLLGEELAAFKQWHCSTQLGAYAALVRQMGDELQREVDDDRIATRFGSVQQFGRLMTDHAAPRLVVLGRAMTRKQFVELGESFDKGNRKYRERWVDASADEIRAERSKRLKELVSWWSGPLGRRQQAMVDAWSRELRLTGAETLASRKRWQRELVRVLETPGDATRPEAELRALLAQPERFWSQALVEEVAANRARTFALLAELANSMDDAQRRRVRTRTAALAADFEALACPLRGAGADAG